MTTATPAATDDMAATATSDTAARGDTAEARYWYAMGQLDTLARLAAQGIAGLAVVAVQLAHTGGRQTGEANAGERENPYIARRAASSVTPAAAVASGPAGCRSRAAEQG